jgi:hypothetical protein
MPRETDLLRVKLVAHTLLDVQIQETALSPVIVSHPFTSSGISALRNEDGSLSMVDLINNSDDCTRWRRKVGEQIDSAENVHQIFVLLNPPYYLTFIKFAASALSEKDLGQLLSTAWTQEECPNQDCNVSKRELVALFRSVSPESLMDEEERTAHQALEDTVTVYRGVTPYNAKNIRALSWTLDRKTADRFAHRFGEDGTVYEAQIRKEHILALFTGRNESEAIVTVSSTGISRYSPSVSTCGRWYFRYTPQLVIKHTTVIKQIIFFIPIFLFSIFSTLPFLLGSSMIRCVPFAAV